VDFLSYSARDLLKMHTKEIMAKSATFQELQVLRNIPSSCSGHTVAIAGLAENLQASERAVRLILSHLHRKKLVKTDNPEFTDGSSLCSRTEAGDSAVAKRYRFR
jgi:Zn-finger domain-containing protein